MQANHNFLVLFFVLYPLLVHWVGDYLFQSTELATTKKNNIKSLLKHTAIYSFVWFCALVFYHPMFALSFAGITFVAHTIQDFITSKIVGHYHDLGDSKKEYGWIGIDQYLHYCQIYITLILLALV